jgi:rhamnose transport system substrate-binding protein
MKGKTLLFVSLLLVAGMLFAGCATAATPAAEAPSEEAPATEEVAATTEETPSEAAPAEAAAVEKASQNWRIAFIPQLVGIPYFDAMKAGGEQAAKDFGVTYMDVGSPEASAAEQVRLMENLIQQKVDAISISVLDSVSPQSCHGKSRAGWDQGLHIR